MNNFLWAVLMYFESYLEHDKAKSDENVYTPGYVDVITLSVIVDLCRVHIFTDELCLSSCRSLGKAARERLKKCEYQLRQRQTNLGHIYMRFVLGLGHRNSHHTKAGRYNIM